MKRQKTLLFVVAVLLMGGTTLLLARLQNFYRLGQPAVKTSKLPDPSRLRVDLPENLPGYHSKWLDPAKEELGTLPPDTSFGKCIYWTDDGFEMQMTVVLMGTDRTSLHKPQFCLEGQGCHIDSTGTLTTTIPMTQPCAYDLPVVRLFTNNEKRDPSHSRGVYVYWYVADGAMSASVSGLQRMWMMSQKLLTTGVLQRWSYVSCFSQCAPGQEEATYERMKKLITAAVPEFQLTPAAPTATAQVQTVPPSTVR